MEAEVSGGDEWAPNGRLPHNDGMIILYLDFHVKYLKCVYDKHGSADSRQWTYTVPPQTLDGPWVCTGCRYPDNATTVP